MRYVILGAGAIGGTLAARLFEQGRDVVLVARGPHREALVQHGLRFATPERVVTFPVPTVSGPEEVKLSDDDVLVVAVKSQDTRAALEPWAAASVGAGFAGERLRVMCVQNGVENERVALRSFRRVYGCCVLMPASYLRPGEITAVGTPLSGVLHVGRYPRGLDATASAIVADLSASRMAAYACEHVMRWKYAKLLRNLGNALDAYCITSSAWEDLYDRAMSEGRAVLDAASIECASPEEEDVARALVERGRVEGKQQPGTSTWQSVLRGTGSIEVDYLNGEIVLLGRSVGVPTPVNEAIQQVANRAARDGSGPRSVDPEAIRRLVAALSREATYAAASF